VITREAEKNLFKEKRCVGENQVRGKVNLPIVQDSCPHPADGVRKAASSPDAGKKKKRERDSQMVAPARSREGKLGWCVPVPLEGRRKSAGSGVKG